MPSAAESGNAGPGALTFFDAEVQECPYAAYRQLQDEAPVYRDPVTGFYVITRYDDLRRILLDTETFRNGRGAAGADRRAVLDSDRAADARPLRDEGLAARAHACGAR